jgi:tRNA modification GTPase
VVVISKADLPLRLDPGILRSQTAGLPTFNLSVVTGEGFPDFVAALSARCRAADNSQVSAAPAPNFRHRDALERAAVHLETAAAQLLSQEVALDCMAIELRAALAALGEITGQTATEEILERIFARFCVGK